MTQEQEDLLLKDLCARLPYDVKVFYEYVDSLNKKTYGYSLTLNTWCIDEMKAEKAVVKPYLFPLSSMSEDQKYEFYLKFFTNDCDFDYFKFYLDNGKWHKLLTSLLAVEEIIDWFHKNHIDYRGLIPMGIANDATGKNIY